MVSRKVESCIRSVAEYKSMILRSIGVIAYDVARVVDFECVGEGCTWIIDAGEGRAIEHEPATHKSLAVQVDTNDLLGIINTPGDNGLRSGKFKFCKNASTV